MQMSSCAGFGAHVQSLRLASSELNPVGVKAALLGKGGIGCSACQAWSITMSQLSTSNARQAAKHDHSLSVFYAGHGIGTAIVEILTAVCEVPLFFSGWNRLLLEHLHLSHT
jgi:hypothetical protein